MKLRENENLLVLGLFLGLVGVISAVTLAWVSQLTAEPIQAAELRRQQQAMRRILPDFDNNPLAESISFAVPGEPDLVTFYAVRKQGKLVALAAAAASRRGYAGRVEMLAGLTCGGQIIKVLITKENETPGLGKTVCVRKFTRTLADLAAPAPAGLPPNKYLDQFSELDIAAPHRWHSIKNGGDFEYRTGATVSSEAVISLVGVIAQTYCEHRSAILKAFEER